MKLLTIGSWDGSGLPGQAWPYREETYGFKGHVKEVGSGNNVLRTDHIAQPRALKPGDTLATGIRILGEPRCGYNSCVLLQVEGNTFKPGGEWIELAARLPLALFDAGDKQGVGRSEYFALPPLLVEGDIIGDGDAVLAAPFEGSGEFSGFTMLPLTGGLEGHVIDVHPHIPIALLSMDDNAPKGIWKYAKKNAPIKGPYSMKK